MPYLPTDVYRLKCGSSDELLRDNQTDKLDKLQEWLDRYKARPGVTNIIVTRYEPQAVNGKLVSGDPVVMVALHREQEDAPWMDLSPAPRRR